MTCCQCQHHVGTPCLDVNCHGSRGRFWKLMSYFVLITQPYKRSRNHCWVLYLNTSYDGCKRNTKFTASQMDSNCQTNLIELEMPEAFIPLKTSMNNTWTIQYIHQNQSFNTVNAITCENHYICLTSNIKLWFRSFSVDCRRCIILEC